MHTRDTYIDEDSITISQNLVDFKIVEVGFDLDSEFVIFYLNETLIPNQPFSLHMEFVRYVNSSLKKSKMKFLKIFQI